MATLIWSLLPGVYTISAGRQMLPTVMGDCKPQALVQGFTDLL